MRFVLLKRNIKAAPSTAMAGRSRLVDGKQQGIAITVEGHATQLLMLA